MKNNVRNRSIINSFTRVYYDDSVQKISQAESRNVCIKKGVKKRKIFHKKMNRTKLTHYFEWYSEFLNPNNIEKKLFATWIPTFKVSVNTKHNSSFYIWIQEDLEDNRCVNLLWCIIHKQRAFEEICLNRTVFDYSTLIELEGMRDKAWQSQDNISSPTWLREGNRKIFSHKYFFILKTQWATQ
jgi:hypothetical protein